MYRYKYQQNIDQKIRFEQCHLQTDLKMNILIKMQLDTEKLIVR